MPQIRILPELLVNKIAAGEVIERPASVVKELVENAIDAGALHVRVEVADGGKQLIRVTDDGCGMSADEVRLAVAPHATSKLATEDDLYRIGTLGFRGEALASIGAVSKLRIVSRPADSDEGAEIRVSAERVESCGVAGAPGGTSVEVRDLFFNVPARRKFLRTTATEMGHISEQLTRIALPNPHIAFELQHNNRVTQRLSAGQNRAERIGALFDASLAEDLIHIERNERGLGIEAYAAPPARSKASAAGQYIFLNGRFIRDRVLNYAIREAYRGLMEHNRYPVIFLFLTLDPSEVDVNVHPTKIEVRWQDSNLVRSQVLSALRETFLRSDLTPALITDATGPLDDDAREQIRQKVAEQLKASLPPGAALPAGFSAPAAGSIRSQEVVGSASAVGSGTGRVAGQTMPRPASPDQSSRGAADLWRSLYESDGQDPADLHSDATLAQLQARQPADAGTHRAAPDQRRPAVQLHNTYLVTETDDGMVIIDQHALHERILYDQLRERLTTGTLESQRLLLPETLEVTPRQLAVIEERRELLSQLGIDAAPFGRSAIAIHTFPVLLADTDVRGFMRDLLDKLEDQNDQPDTERVIHALLDMMACKAAVKAGDPLTPEEIEALLASKELADKPSNCPHGRPTTLRLNLKDLERQFKRT